MIRLTFLDRLYNTQRLLGWPVMTFGPKRLWRFGGTPILGNLWQSQFASGTVTPKSPSSPSFRNSGLRNEQQRPVGSKADIMWPLGSPSKWLVTMGHIWWNIWKICGEIYGYVVKYMGNMWWNIWDICGEMYGKYVHINKIVVYMGWFMGNTLLLSGKT